MCIPAVLVEALYIIAKAAMPQRLCRARSFEHVTRNDCTHGSIGGMLLLRLITRSSVFLAHSQHLGCCLQFDRTYQPMKVFSL